MRSILPIAICFGCLLAITYPAFAKDKSTQSNTQIKRCVTQDKKACTRKPVKRGQLYELGLPKNRRDGRTRHRIQIK